jgi:sec-independent protein translocase protein TatA
MGETEGLVIILAIVLLFGAKRIPDVAKSLGAGIREFRKATRDIAGEDTKTTGVASDPPKVVEPGRAPQAPPPASESPHTSGAPEGPSRPPGAATAPRDEPS